MFVFVIVFFFFKQKTAYEMRISDWSSDVCSSDLQDDARYSRNSLHCGGRRTSGRQKKRAGLFESAGNKGRSGRASGVMFARARDPFLPPAKGTAPFSIDGFVPRSEEHTSELQSLMRISYAVFCLTKQNDTNPPPKLQQQLQT